MGVVALQKFTTTSHVGAVPLKAPELQSSTSVEFTEYPLPQSASDGLHVVPEPMFTHELLTLLAVVHVHGGVHPLTPPTLHTPAPAV